MAKKIAIEWDARELRVVAGITRGASVTITDISSTPIESTEPTALGETLKRVLSGLGLEKASAAIALGRGKAEMRELKLPPVPDAELPDMVRFQAIRTFAGAGERSAIDYLPTRSDADGIRVLAAAVGPDELKSCALIAVPAALSVERIVLRPLAAAALFRRQAKEMAGEIVLIDLLADEADIVILRDGVPSFVRSIRLPEDPAVRIRTLSGEVRRSLMACQEGQSDDNAPRHIVLWGRAAVHADEVAGLSDSLKTTVATLDPFSVVEVDSRLQSKLPEHVGRLAPLIGLLDADARGGHDLIDFLNPRRPPAPKSNKGRYLVMSVAAASLVAVCGYFGWQRHHTLANEIVALEAAYADLADAEKAADLAIAKTARVETFLDGDVFWLDELRRTAMSMPSSDKAIVDSISTRIEAAGGGSLTLEGGVTNSEIVGAFESSLRDADHRVVGSGTSLVSNKSPYDWGFTEKIVVSSDFVRRSHGTAPAEIPAAQAAVSPSDTTTPNSSAAAEPANREPASTEPASPSVGDAKPAVTESTSAEETPEESTSSESTETEPEVSTESPPAPADAPAPADVTASADTSAPADAPAPADVPVPAGEEGATK